jgi:hypothetical protein
MAYYIAWGLYITAAVLLQFGCERYLTPYLTVSSWRIFMRALLAIALFTPGVGVDDGQYYLVPALVGVVFHLLSHQFYGVLQALLPLLLVSGIVFTVLFMWYREPAAAE